MANKFSLDRSKVNKKFIDQRFGMIGPSGIGKSGFWTHEDKALFLDTEGGLNAYGGIIRWPIRDLNDMRDAYRQLVSYPKDNFPFSVIIIDTIDRLVDYATDETLAEAREKFKRVDINTIHDVPEGGGWDRRRTKVSVILKELEKLPCAIAYIGHLENKTIRRKGETDYNKHTISIGGKIGGDLLAWTDHTMTIEAVRVGEKLVRTVFTLPTQSREAKSRGGMVPNAIRWGDNDKENYEKFRALFE